MANNQPIFTSVGDVQWTISAMTVANITSNITGGTIYLAFSADSTNGGYVQRIRFRPLVGTNTVATVARVWINNGGVTTSAENNTLFDEITLPTTTLNNAAAQSNFELPLNIALPPGDRIYITLGQAPTGPGWQATVIGGKY